jgi:tight adherence protein C
MTIAVDAGLGLDAAMLRATQKMSLQSEGLQREWEAAWMEMQAGVPRATALRNLADRCGLEDLQLLVTLLNSAEQMGVPIAGALRNFAATLRLKRHQRAEECAAQMPTKLLFPLVVFILPVMLMVVGGPAAIQILRTLASLQH